MHKSDRTAAGCTVEDEPYKLLERDAEKSILAGPLSSPSEQLPFPASLKAPVPLTHDAVTVPVMFGRRTSQGILVSQTLATTQAIQAFFHRQSVAVPGAAVPLDTRTLGTVHIFPLELLTAPMVRHLSFNQPRFA